MGLFKSVISRGKKGLERTRDAFVGGLRSILLGRRVDEALIADLERRLLEADVGPKATARLVGGVREAHRAGRMDRGEDVLGYMKRELKAMWPPQDRALHLADSGPTVILVTGINGVGKTTTIAKLAHALRSQGRRILVGACDTFRAGAVRQLEVWADRIGVDLVRGPDGADPAAVAFDAVAAGVARKADVVILDTAGRLHTRHADASWKKSYGSRGATCPARRERCSCSTPPAARTRSGRPRSSQRPRGSPASCSPSSTARPRAAW